MINPDLDFANARLTRALTEIAALTGPTIADLKYQVTAARGKLQPVDQLLVDNAAAYSSSLAQKDADSVAALAATEARYETAASAREAAYAETLAERDAAIASLQAQVADLQAEVADLDAQLHPVPPAPVVPQWGRKPEVRDFWAGTFWCQSVADAPVHANSAAIIAELVSKAGPGHGYINIMKDYDTRFYVADESTPRVRLGYEDRLSPPRGKTPSWFYTPTPAPFANFPVPDGIQGASGSDAAVSVWIKPTNEAREAWRFGVHEDGWLDFDGIPSRYSAVSGGVIPDMSTNPGWFLKGGVTATGLPMACTNIGIDEVYRARAAGTGLGRVIGFSAPAPSSSPRYVWPAQRGDGGSATALLREGMRIRLRRDFDVEGHDCHELQRIILRDAPEYGFVLKDRAGAVTFTTESGAPIVEECGVNPWIDILGGASNSDVMHGFPWDQFEVLPEGYGRPA